MKATMRRHGTWGSLVGLVVVALLGRSLHAQARPEANLWVGHDYWTSKDGAPGDIQALAQTNDGFLWLGSPSGLFRFDGTRFERFKSPFGHRLLSTNVMCLLAPPSGGLWIGYTFGGFSFLDNGQVTNYPLDAPVRTFARNRNGILWAATAAGLWKFEGSRWEQVGAKWNAPTGPVLQVAFDSQGTLWVLAGIDFDAMDVLYLKAGAKEFRTAARSLSVLGFTLNADGEAVTEPAPGPLLSGSGGHSDVHLSAWPVLRKDSHQIVDRNNSVWVAPRGPAAVMRLSSRDRLRDAVAKASPANSETWNFSPFPLAKLIDREGNIWFGEQKGLHRFWYSALHQLELPKTAAENAGFALAPDDNGAVWMSVGGWYTPSVLLHTSGGKPERQAIQAAIRAPFAHRAPDGTFWFIGKDCLLHLVGREIVRVSLPPEVVSQTQYLQAITEDHRGGMWVSFLRYGLYRLAGGVWRAYGDRIELPKAEVLSEFTDSVGRVWLGYIKNQLALVDGDHVRLFGSGDGLRVGNISAIYGRGRAVWIGGEFGLARFENGRLQTIAAVNDEWLRGISGIVETSDGDLWLNGLSGIFHISRTELSEAITKTFYRVKGDHFGRREGLPGVPTQVHPLPTAIEGTDGRLWFALQNGVVWLDPATYVERRVPPPAVSIQWVSANNKDYASTSSPLFPARTSSVQFSYAAVSLSNPEAIRVRYKLQEEDEDWHEVASAAPVTFSNLPPGSYHFTVNASDTNGLWSDRQASAEFTIAPAYYQTVWFRTSAVVAFLLLIAGYHQLRLREAAQRELDLTLIIDTIPGFVWTASRDGQLTYVNQPLFEYIGAPMDALRGQGWLDFVHPDDRRRTIDRWVHSVATGVPLENQYRLRRTDGVYRWFHVRRHLGRTTEGRPTLWYGLLVDIDDRKNIEEALRLTETKLSQAAQVATVGELAASIAHEINQPLGAIVANGNACLRWLSADPSSIGKACEAAERIVRDGLEAGEVIRKIRSLFKGGAVDKTALDLNDVVGEVLRLLGSELVRKSVNLESKLGADLPRVMGDRVQLQQVVHNLIANAIEAMDSVTDRPRTLFVGSSRRGDSILVEIRDSGTGIKEADKIFDAFFTTKKNGLGMGLAICRSIIEAHHGKLWASSADGAGSTFCFSVPAQNSIL